MSGKQLSSRSKKVEWLRSNQDAWRGRVVCKNGVLIVDDWSRLRIVGAMKGAGLVAQTTLSCDVNLGRMIADIVGARGKSDEEVSRLVAAPGLIAAPGRVGHFGLPPPPPAGAFSCDWLTTEFADSAKVGGTE